MTMLFCLLVSNIIGWLLFRRYERHLERQIQTFRMEPRPRRSPTARRSNVASRARYSGVSGNI